MTNHYDRTQLPPTRDFFEGELGRLYPAGRDQAKANCPFHPSKSKRSLSVDLATGLWFCHGCQVGGDMVSFVRLRDRCSFVDACKTLGAWRGDITPQERTEITRRAQEREWNRQREAEAAEAAMRRVLTLRDHLHSAYHSYQTVDGDLHQDGPDDELNWALLPGLLDDCRVLESRYCESRNIEDPWGLQ
jgi:DNA primase